MNGQALDKQEHAFDLMVDGIRTLISVSSFIMTVLLGFMSVIDKAKMQYLGLGLWGVCLLALAITLCIYLQGIAIRMAQDGSTDIDQKGVRYPYAAILWLMFLGMTFAILFGILNIIGTPAPAPIAQ